MLCDRKLAFELMLNFPNIPESLYKFDCTCKTERDKIIEIIDLLSMHNYLSKSQIISAYQFLYDQYIEKNITIKDFLVLTLKFSTPNNSYIIDYIKYNWILIGNQSILDKILFISECIIGYDELLIESNDDLFKIKLKDFLDEILNFNRLYYCNFVDYCKITSAKSKLEDFSLKLGIYSYINIDNIKNDFIKKEMLKLENILNNSYENYKNELLNNFTENELYDVFSLFKIEDISILESAFNENEEIIKIIKNVKKDKSKYVF